jgi:hypothetical protein
MSHQVKLVTAIDDIDDLETMLEEVFGLKCVRNGIGKGYYKKDVVNYDLMLVSDFKRDFGFSAVDGKMQLQLDSMDHGRLDELLRGKVDEAYAPVAQVATRYKPIEMLTMCYQAHKAVTYHEQLGRSIEMSVLGGVLEIVAEDAGAVRI